MTKLKFIHTADLHIDTPFKGLGRLPEDLFKKIKDSTFVAFERMIATAIKKEIDFLVISGDLYDEANRSLKAQLFLRQQFSRLDKVSIQVYIIHGNHDHLSGEWIELTWPANVHFFTGSKPSMIPFRRDEKTLAHLYGYSYPNREVTENIARHYSIIEGAPFHIALLHGTMGRNTDHPSYAPFLLSDLISHSFDYWALGHIHKRKQLYKDPFIVYPGNIQGLNRKETGAKGCYLVEMSSTESSINFIDLAPIRWETFAVTIDELIAFEDLILILREIKEQFRYDQTSTILSIEISSSNDVANLLKDRDYLDDLLLLLQDGEEGEAPFVWVHRLTFKSTDNTMLLDQLTDSHFMKEILLVLTDMDQLDPVLAPLWKHRKAKKFLKEEDTGDKEEIVNAAKQLLIESITQP